MKISYEPADQMAFLESFSKEDELGVVLRAHIYIESVLEQLLQALVADPKPLEKMKLDYAAKVQLALALGLKAEHGPALVALGGLRNAFAHDTGASLGKSRMDALYKSLSTDTRDFLVKSYESTKRHFGNKPEPFRSLPSKDQFTLIAVTLRGMLIAGYNNVLEEQAAIASSASNTSSRPTSF